MTKLLHPDWSRRVQLILELMKREKALGTRTMAYFNFSNNLWYTMQLKIP